MGIFLVLPWLPNYDFGPTGVVVQWLSTWMVALLCVLKFNGKRNAELAFAKSVVLTWLIAAVLSATMALFQYFGISSVFGGLIQQSTTGQAYANLRQRNQLATLLSMGLLALIWCSMRPSKVGKAEQMLMVSCAAILGSACAATGSRTGLVQFMLIVAVSVVLRQWRWIVGIAALAYIAGALFLPWTIGLESASGGILGRLTENTAVCSSRLALWSNVLHLISQKPWLGWGWGELDFAHFVTLYPSERFCDILDNAHNLPLHLAVELGVPIAMVLCGVMGWLVWRAKPWRESNPTRQLAWAVLAAIGLHSMLEYPLWYGPFQLAVVLCVWMLYAIPAKHLEKRPVLALPFAIRTSVASVLLGVCVYAAWDYWRISQIYIAPEQRNVAYRSDTLAKIQSSWIFQNQVKFAELTITELTPANAQHMYELALGLLHFSPEPRVVQKLIESATVLGKDAEALYYLQRFKAAFPKEYALWKK